MTETELNQKVTHGLRAQYSTERVSAILTQAESMYQHSQWQSGDQRPPTRPEPYELFESGWIDRALDYLGYGKWAIGRPKFNGNGTTFRHNPRARAKPEPQTLRTEKPQPQPQGAPTLSKIFSQHLPREFPQPKHFGDNAIEFRNVLIVGGQGSGKTTTLEELVETTAETYGHSNVRAYMQTAGIDKLLIYGTKYPSLVRVLGAEDMTLKKIPRDHLNSWFQVRHLVAQRTGWRKGLVVASSNVHTLFGLEKNLRTDFALMVLLTVPTNPYDRSLLKRYFDPDLLSAFETTARKGDALIWDRQHNRGVWVKVDYPSENLLTEFRTTQANSKWDFRFVYGIVGLFGAILVWALYKLVEVGLRIVSHA